MDNKIKILGAFETSKGTIIKVQANEQKEALKKSNWNKKFTVVPTNLHIVCNTPAFTDLNNLVKSVENLTNSNILYYNLLRNQLFVFLLDDYENKKY